MVSTFRGTVAVSKQSAQNLMWKELTSGFQISWRLRDSITLRSQSGLQVWII